MASGSSTEQSVIQDVEPAELSAEWQDIKEEITCSICGDIFTDPKTIIPCLHTFCKRCIEKSIESNTRMLQMVCCPLCRKPLSECNIKYISSNFTISRLIEIYEKTVQIEREAVVTIGELVESFGQHQKAGKATSVETKCGNCEEKLPLTMWCVECKDPLCHDCNELHKKVKAYRSHKVMHIDEFLNDPKHVFRPATSEKTEFCKVHKRQILDRYCKTCSKLICEECASKYAGSDYHKRHIIESIDDVLAGKQERLKEIFISLKQLLKQLQNGINKIECCEKQIDKDCEANIAKIRATYNEQYKILKQQEEAAVEKVTMIKTSFKKTLGIQKENAKRTETQLESYNEFYEKVVTVDRTRELFTYSNWIENKVNEVNEQMEHTSLDPLLKVNHMMVTYKPVVKDLLCDVFSVPICSVTEGPIVLNHQIKLTIMLQDVHEFPMANQLKHLEIHCNKEKKFLRNKCIEEQAEGRYEIRCTPKRMECHSLFVHWRGIVINHEKIQVILNMRDYTSIKNEVMSIYNYGPIKYIPDDPPMDKHIASPYSLSIGPHNELLVRDVELDVLVVFDEHLKYSYVIGGSGHGYGRFSCMTGVAVDKKGHVYIADRDLHCIQKLELKKGGKFISQFGHRGTADGELNCPCNLLLSQSGLLFVCDIENYRIQVFKNDRFSYCFGKRGTEPGAFDQAANLVMNNSEDQLFITDSNNHRIQLFTPKGQFLKVFSNSIGVPVNIPRPSGIHYTPDGHLLISCGITNRVLVYQEDGKFVSSIEGYYKDEVRFAGPQGLMMLKNGQIVVTSFSDNRLVIF